ncbi:MAG TPA: hypothetical protein VK428_15525 [Acidimicrobiales bacterium]|nr:hypothetical protein [Acidimicrobiales bacterium]
MEKRLGVATATTAALALALCACSGASTSGTSTTTTSASDVSLAQAELLPASAFPSGWQSQGTSSENTQASVFGGLSQSKVQAITRCLGISSAQVDSTPAEAADPEYDDPNSSATVTDTVDVFPSAALSRFDTSAAANPKMPSCLVQIAPSFESKVPKSVHLGTVSANRDDIPLYGDEDAALDVTIPFTDQGVSGTLYLVIVVVEKGRSESNLVFTDVQGAPDPSLVDGLSSAAATALVAS